MTAPYELSKKQKAFVRKAKKLELEVQYDYSGRFMYGKKCPAVYLDQFESFSFKGASMDQLGLGTVVYMRD